MKTYSLTYPLNPTQTLKFLHPTKMTHPSYLLKLIPFPLRFPSPDTFPSLPHTSPSPSSDPQIVHNPPLSPLQNQANPPFPTILRMTQNQPFTSHYRPAPQNTHPMVTRARINSLKPKAFPNLSYNHL